MDPASTYFKPRHLTQELKQALSTARVVNIVGPRQVGKTTLVKEIYGRGKFITLDDPIYLNAINQDAYHQLKSLRADLKDEPLIIDEAQRSKEIVLAIKRIVDEDRQKGQFILTGSSNLFALKSVADSLAGRTFTLQLWPLSVAEVLSRKPSKILDWAVSKRLDINKLPRTEVCDRTSYIDYLLRGGFPEIREEQVRTRTKRFRNYITTIIDRDVADISPIRKSDAFKRLVKQLAIRSSGELNIQTLCQAVRIDRRTADQYLDILRRLSLVVKLPSWTSSESKRDIKQAKYHFADTGIISGLRALGERSFDLDANPSDLGALLESFVCLELIKILPYQRREFDLYHWRNQKKKEIDIIAECPEGLIGIEVKASSTLNPKDYKTLKWFATEGPGKKSSFTGIIFYLGAEPLILGKRIYAIPISSLWSRQ